MSHLKLSKFYFDLFQRHFSSNRFGPLWLQSVISYISQIDFWDLKKQHEPVFAYKETAVMNVSSKMETERWKLWHFVLFGWPVFLFVSNLKRETGDKNYLTCCTRTFFPVCWAACWGWGEVEQVCGCVRWVSWQSVLSSGTRPCVLGWRRTWRWGPSGRRSWSWWRSSSAPASSRWPRLRCWLGSEDASLWVLWAENTNQLLSKKHLGKIWDFWFCSGAKHFYILHAFRPGGDGFNEKSSTAR